MLHELKIDLKVGSSNFYQKRYYDSCSVHKQIKNLINSIKSGNNMKNILPLKLL